MNPHDEERGQKLFVLGILPVLLVNHLHRAIWIQCLWKSVPLHYFYYIFNFIYVVVLEGGMCTSTSVPRYMCENPEGKL